MAKNPGDKNKKAELVPENAEIEKRVKAMMEPESKEAKATETKAGEPSTAPEVAGLPVPDEPLKIKILHDDKESQEASSAPELATAEANVEEASAKAEQEPVVDEAESQEAEQAPPTDPATQEASAELKEDEPSEDPETSKAVEDIVRHESDELLKAEDDKLLAAFQPAAKKSFGQKIKAAIADLWKNPKKRKMLLGSLVILVIIAGVVPGSRYFILNTAGVRASASVHVIDESTLQPLKNVRVNVHGAEAVTDENGDARIEKVKLGTTQLKIERRAFATVERKVTIGWGSNPLGEEKLRPTGTQYAFAITDFLSGRGIFKAEAVSSDASAFSNEEGKLLLTMEDPPDEIDISITREGHRTEHFKFHADTKDETSVKMVPARKHAYISRRDAGRYDVYAAYADGKDEKLVLKGSGNERDDTVLIPHPSEDLIALVSTREGKRNKDGFLLSNLNIVDLRTKSVEAVETSERIQVINWFGERLAYVRVISGSSAGNPKRNRLMAYHYKDDTNNELAASNYFNDVMAIGDRIYYAPSGAYAKGINVNLFSVKADNTDRKIILDREVWNMFRTRYDHIAVSAPGSWYDYRVGDERPTALKGEPPNLKSRVYTDSPNKQKSLWVDSRDGKGVLIVHDVKSGEEKTLRSQPGLKNPVRWLNDNTIVYRIKTDTETADYALSLDGGEPKKLADVTNTDGIDRWYYY
jgi:hypothetical protein